MLKRAAFTPSPTSDHNGFGGMTTELLVRYLSAGIGGGTGRGDGGNGSRRVGSKISDDKSNCDVMTGWNPAEKKPEEAVEEMPSIPSTITRKDGFTREVRRGIVEATRRREWSVRGPPVGPNEHLRSMEKPACYCKCRRGLSGRISGRAGGPEIS